MPTEIDPDFKVFFPEYLARPCLVDTNGLAVLEDDEWGWVRRCGRRDKGDANEGWIEGGAKWSRACRGENTTPAEQKCRRQYDHALAYENRIGDDLLCVLAVEGSFYECRGADGRGDAVGIRV